MATDFGGCLWTRTEVIPGQVVKYPAPIAFVHMERAVNPEAAFKKAMRLAMQGLVAVLHGASGAVAIFVMEATGQCTGGYGICGRFWGCGGDVY